MSLLRSNSMKVILSDNGVLTDYSEEARTWANPAISLSWVAAEDALYIGRPHQFNFLYVNVSTANSSPSALTVSYWNFSNRTWTPFTDLVDETGGLATSGFISWQEQSELDAGTSIIWDKDDPARITGLDSLTWKRELFFVKITLASNSSAATKIQAIKTLLSDDRLMTVIHPEIMEYLPSGETTFLKQHELAKDEIVNFLIVKGLISYEEQMKNPDDWILPATYKCLSLILAPISGDERLTQLKKDFAARANETLLMSAGSIDRNKSETLEKAEKEPGTERHLSR